jgi:hypothetical protein
MNEPTVRPSAARRYLRYLAACAHEAGLPYLPTDQLSARQVGAWIDYLRIVITAQERVDCVLDEGACRARETVEASSPYLVTPPASRLPSSYRPPWQDLPSAEDHEHVIGTVTREDGITQSVCVLCGASA